MPLKMAKKFLHYPKVLVTTGVMKFSILELMILQTGLALGAGFYYLQRLLGAGTRVAALEFYADVIIGLSVGLVICLVRRKQGGSSAD